jgi:hypothetical protein
MPAPPHGKPGTHKTSQGSEGEKTCRHCGTVFPSKNALHRHIRSEHQASAGGIGRPRPGGNPAQGVVGAAIHIPHPAGVVAMGSGVVEARMLPPHAPIQLTQPQPGLIGHAGGIMGLHPVSNPQALQQIHQVNLEQRALGVPGKGSGMGGMAVGTVMGGELGVGMFAPGMSGELGAGMFTGGRPGVGGRVNPGIGGAMGMGMMGGVGIGVVPTLASVGAKRGFDAISYDPTGLIGGGGLVSIGARDAKRAAPGPALHKHLNNHIVQLEHVKDLTTFIEIHAGDFNAVNVATAWRVLLTKTGRSNLMRNDPIVRASIDRLGDATLATISDFGPRQCANTLHSIAKSSYKLDDKVLGALVVRAEVCACLCLCVCVCVCVCWDIFALNLSISVPSQHLPHLPLPIHPNTNHTDARMCAHSPRLVCVYPTIVGADFGLLQAMARDFNAQT